MQQINLYQIEFRKKLLPMSANQLLWGVALLCLLLSGVSGVRAWMSLTLAEKIQLKETRLQNTNTELAQVKLKYAKPGEDPELQEKLEKLKSEVAVKQQIINVMAEKTFGNAEGFVEQVTGLARQRIEGMWLTDVQILAGGTQMMMQGSAVRPELLPQFLQRLSNEMVFRGVEFNSFVMQRDEKKPNQVMFSLKSVNGQNDK